MCGPFLGGFWWIVPLVGFLVCLSFMLTANRTGRARMCLGGRSSLPNDIAGTTSR